MRCGHRYTDTETDTDTDTPAHRYRLALTHTQAHTGTHTVALLNANKLFGFLVELDAETFALWQ